MSQPDDPSVVDADTTTDDAPTDAAVPAADAADAPAQAADAAASIGPAPDDYAGRIDLGRSDLEHALSDAPQPIREVAQTAESAFEQVVPMALWQQAQGVLGFELVRFAGQPITIATVLMVLLIVLLTFRISSAAQQIVDRTLRRSGLSRHEGTIAALRRLVHYAIILIGFGIALDTLGVDLAALFTAGAVFAVAFGFAMQNIAQNFVSGLLLLMERSIKPGDILDLGTGPVQVVEMRIRTTIVRTLDEEEVIVPNTDLVQSRVKNFTLRDALYRLRTEVGVSYDSDLREVDAVLQSTADAIPWRLQQPPPRVLLKGFGASSVDFEVSVWIDDPWRAQVHRSLLNHAIWNALHEVGVVIAFPQLDVHVDDALVGALRDRADGRRSAV